MDIIFANKKLEKFANDIKLTERKLGYNQAILLHKRINDFYDAENFSVLLDLPGHHHPLTENRSGQWACNLVQPSRLVYEPVIQAEVGNKEGIFNLTQFEKVSIVGIIDYHDKKTRR